MLVLCGFVLIPRLAQAQCVEFKDPAELFKLSDAVFVGTVVAIEPTGIEGSHVAVSIGTLIVERTWKGHPGHEVRVRSDVPFEVRQKYVVFAGGRLLFVTVMCHAAELVDRATRKMEWLARRRSHPGS